MYPPNSSKFQLSYQEPYQWSALLHFLSLHLFAGVESISENHYRRHGEGWQVTVSHQAGKLLVETAGPAPPDTQARVRHLFDLFAPIQEIENHLSQFPNLGIHAHPGLRLPGCWDSFELVIRAILGQHVSVKGATTLSARLVERFGPPTARSLADADVAVIGLTKSRAASIRAIAQAVLDGTVDLHDAASLEAVKGIGPWTAQYALMRTAHSADAFPASDLVLMKNTGHSNPRSLAAAAAAWRPYRAYAAMHIWQRGLTTQINLCNYS